MEIIVCQGDFESDVEMRSVYINGRPAKFSQSFNLLTEDGPMVAVDVEPYLSSDVQDASFSMEFAITDEVFDALDNDLDLTPSLKP